MRPGEGLGHRHREFGLRAGVESSQWRGGMYVARKRGVGFAGMDGGRMKGSDVTNSGLVQY
jgi:hypothetical protein